MTVRVYVSIGSNIEPAANVAGALKELSKRFGALTVSTVYRCPPVGFEGPDFYNLVVGFDTSDSVSAVRRELRDIEKLHHRERRSERFYDRTLDLDMLLYGDMVGEKDGLRLPRPEILQYAFVLRPLAEIAFGQRHPETGLSYAEHWRQFDGSGQPMWPLADTGVKES